MFKMILDLKKVSDVVKKELVENAKINELNLKVYKL